MRSEKCCREAQGNGREWYEEMQRKEKEKG